MAAAITSAGPTGSMSISKPSASPTATATAPPARAHRHRWEARALVSTSKLHPARADFSLDMAESGIEQQQRAWLALHAVTRLLAEPHYHNPLPRRAMPPSTPPVPTNSRSASPKTASSPPASCTASSARNSQDNVLSGPGTFVPRTRSIGIYNCEKFSRLFRLPTTWKTVRIFVSSPLHGPALRDEAGSTGHRRLPGVV